jgi:hypothetical protein
LFCWNFADQFRTASVDLEYLIKRLVVMMLHDGLSVTMKCMAGWLAVLMVCVTMTCMFV